MANRPKKRIDYAGWSVDIFSNDTKIDKLLDAQGWVGFGIYFYLCQMAFGSEGYFYEWCYDLCATTARKMGGGVGAGTVKETVDYCLQIGLFNKRLFDRWQVLTSRGIQKSYLLVLKSKNRKGTEIYKEFWLLDKKEGDYQGVIFVSKNNEKLEVISDSLGVKDDSLEANEDSLRQKESKGNKSKGEESINTFCAEPEEPAHTPPVITLILNDKSEHPVYQKTVDSFSDLYPAVDIMQEFRKMKGWLDNNPTKRKTKRGINRFINNWLSKAQDRGGSNKNKNDYGGFLNG